MAILLTEIRRTGANVYELQFMDEGQPVAFTFVHHPERGRVEGNHEFGVHFDGRTSGREAMIALGKFIEGRPVNFPVELPWTGASSRL